MLALRETLAPLDGGDQRRELDEIMDHGVAACTTGSLSDAEKQSIALGARERLASCRE